jgi:hypothetical protein
MNIHKIKIKGFFYYHESGYLDLGILYNIPLKESSYLIPLLTYRSKSKNGEYLNGNLTRDYLGNDLIMVKDSHNTELEKLTKKIEISYSLDSIILEGGKDMISIVIKNSMVLFYNYSLDISRIIDFKNSKLYEIERGSEYSNLTELMNFIYYCYPVTSDQIFEVSNMRSNFHRTRREIPLGDIFKKLDIKSKIILEPKESFGSESHKIFFD